MIDMRSSHRRLLLVSVLVLSFSAVSAEQAFWTGNVPPTPQARRDQAREWLDGFRLLDRQIPTLSPTERAWLKTEYDDQIASANGKFTERALAATSSTEYHKRLARQGLDLILGDLAKLTNSTRPSRSDEVVVWTHLAADMVNPQFWQSVEALRERKVVTGELNGVKDFFFESHAMWARLVLDRVVVPMLESGKP